MWCPDSNQCWLYVIYSSDFCSFCFDFAFWSTPNSSPGRLLTLWSGIRWAGLGRHMGCSVSNLDLIATFKARALPPVLSHQPLHFWWLYFVTRKITNWFSQAKRKWMKKGQISVFEKLITALVLDNQTFRQIHLGSIGAFSE